VRLKLCHGLLVIFALGSGCDRDRTQQARLGAASGRDPVVQALGEAGYRVELGRVRPFQIQDCVPLPSCFGSNATSPYLIFQLPVAPTGEPADIWRLRADEAVLVLGSTPPKAAYFSYTPYVFTRYDAASAQQRVVYASISDSLNQVNLQVEGGTQFDARFALIMTADAVAEREIRQTLARTGLAQRATNTLPLPIREVRLGLETEADQLQLLGRIALFEDDAAKRSYLSDPPLRVFRVTPRSVRKPGPLPPRARVARGSGRDERSLGPAVEALDAAIRAAHGAQTIDRVTIFSAATVASVLDPSKCLAQLSNCMGDISDTTYSAGPLAVARGGPPSRLSADAHDFYIAFGVNHEAAGKATYANVVVQNQARQAGVVGFTSRQMPGSAQVYLPDHPDAPKLFAVKITRDCAEQPFCLEVPVGFPGVDIDADQSFVFRAYLEPGRSVSSAPEELLTERVLHVH
jgi:hypothetical protein